MKKITAIKKIRCFSKKLAAVVLACSLGVLTACTKEPAPDASTAPSKLASTPGSSSNATLSDSVLGEWRSDLAKPILERQLDRVVWLGKNVGCEGVCEVQHTSVKEFDLMVGTSPEKIVLTASNDVTNGCHACAPALSLFRFRKTESGWTLSSSDMAFANVGANGKVSGDRPMQASVATLSANQIAFMIDVTDAHQGFQETTQFVFVSVDGKFVPAFKEKSGEDFSGVNAEIKNAGTIWDSKVEIEVMSEPKILVINSSGKRAGKPFTTTKRYQFDGMKFVPI